MCHTITNTINNYTLSCKHLYMVSYSSNNAGLGFWQLTFIKMTFHVIKREMDHKIGISIPRVM